VLLLQYRTRDRTGGNKYTGSKAQDLKAHPKISMGRLQKGFLHVCHLLPERPFDNLNAAELKHFQL